MNPLVKDWKRDGEWCLSPGVCWCPAGFKIQIGESATVGRGAIILDRVKIGERARIGNRTTIGYGVNIGEGATIGNGVRIGNGTRIGDGGVVPHGVHIGKRKRTPGLYINGLRYTGDQPGVSVPRVAA